MEEQLKAEKALRETVEKQATEALELLRSNNEEIDELKDTLEQSEKVNAKLRRENHALNEEALDLANKIHLMDKMYKSLQSDYDTQTEKLYRQKLDAKDKEVLELKQEIIKTRLEFTQYKDKHKENEFKQITRDVSTDSFWIYNWDRDTPEKTPINVQFSEEKLFSELLEEDDTGHTEIQVSFDASPEVKKRNCKSLDSTENWTIENSLHSESQKAVVNGRSFKYMKPIILTSFIPLIIFIFFSINFRG